MDLSSCARAPNRAPRPKFALTLALAACAACHGSTPAPAAPPPARVQRAPEQRAARPESFAVSGLLGALSPQEIRAALEPRLPKFSRCVAQRREQIELLSGTITLAFHLAVDGAVAAVQPSDSNLGDREAERCILSIAQATRFPAPHGGEADFHWPLELPADPEVRPPVELDAAFARAPKSSKGTALMATCGGAGQVVVTAYVDPEGKVIAAGAATPDPTTDVRLDCIAQGVRSWDFASPGSYPGKLSFTLP